MPNPENEDGTLKPLRHVLGLNEKSEAFVKKVVSEAISAADAKADSRSDSVNNYLEKVNQPGNRISHYNETVRQFPSQNLIEHLSFVSPVRSRSSILNKSD